MTNLFTAERYSTGAAIVIGGSGGVGKAICRELAAAGADITLSYNRNRRNAEELAHEIEKLGRRALCIQVDMRDADSMQVFAEKAAAEFGDIHTAVYAAGPQIPMRFISKIEPAQFQAMVGTDVFGCFNMIAATLPYLRKTRGVLLSVGTPAAQRFVKSDVMSAAPKAAIEALVRGVAVEEGRYGIRANCVGVGVISDGMFHQLVAEGHFNQTFLDKTCELVALKRIGTAKEVAAVFAFLASDKASYVTGQYLMVDGGFAV